MSWAERLQTVLVALAALAGLAAGAAGDFGRFAEPVVLPALLMMITAVFVQLNFTQVRQVRGAGSLVICSLVLNYLVTPLLAWGLGAGLLADQPDLRIGLLLLLVTPCTDWYLVFTALARGHTGIATALLPVNLILQLMLLPVYVMLLGGNAASVSLDSLVEAIVVVLLIPLTLATTLRWVSRRADLPALDSARLDRWASAVVIPMLCVAVFAMFLWQAPTVLSHTAELLYLLLPLGVFFLVLPVLATLSARALKLPGPQRVTLTMVTVARNSPIALGIAVVAFPDRPLIALALVLGPLVELPVLAVLSQVLRHRERRTLD